ncbi:MAG TPA: L,D-transpeptidase family protein [Acidimicrobiales bacterium]|nr:L,D-transpeptidase family protein [Acidimicrobiales bacterium]
MAGAQLVDRGMRTARAAAMVTVLSSIGIPVLSATALASPVRSPARHLDLVDQAVSPFVVVSTAPSARATGVSATAPIVVRFSKPLSPSSPSPSIVPSTNGAWRESGSAFIFTPEVAFIPLSNIALTVPDGPSGVRSIAGNRLAQATLIRFQIENGSVLRMQQLLALTDYSPLKIARARHSHSIHDVTAQRLELFNPPNARFVWRDSGWPVNLQLLWKPGQYNVFTSGLVMAFQADHGMTPNGVLSFVLWSTLLNSYQSGQKNSGGYNYSVVDKTVPESLKVWHDGQLVMSSPANTGIPGESTPNGNFPVYLRLRAQVMTGTNPNGSHYADPVQYVAYFVGGDAVHYMPRSSYGTPQSLGCVELPIQQAATTWPYLGYGTIVSVID